MTYQDGPIKMEGNSGEHPKFKTFLSATKEEINDHGFLSDFDKSPEDIEPTYDESENCYFIDEKGKLQRLSEQISEQSTVFPFFMCRKHDWAKIEEVADNHGLLPSFRLEETYPYRDRADVTFAYNNSVFREKKRYIVLNVDPTEKHPEYISHRFEFNNDAIDLFQNLSDVEDMVKTAESMKDHIQKILLTDVRATVTKKDEHYCVHFRGGCDLGHGRDLFFDDFPSEIAPKTEYDIEAKGMKEFLPKFQETELEFWDSYLRSAKKDVAVRREEKAEKLQAIEKIKDPEEREIRRLYFNDNEPSDKTLDELDELIDETLSQREVESREDKEEDLER